MDWIIAHPAAATALATMALVAVGLVIGTGQIAVVWYGVSRMVRAGEAREREQERRHKEVMEEGERRHKQATEDGERRHRETMEEGERRHKQRMEEHKERMEAFSERNRLDERRHEEAMESLAAQRRALEALIERTAPPAAPAE